MQLIRGLMMFRLDFRLFRLASASLAVCLLLAGCGSRSNGGLTPVAGTVPGASKVDLFIATTRQPSEVPGQMFTGERDQRINYAEVTISIPPDSARKIGDVQMASSDVGNPATDFVALRAEKLDEPTAVKRFHDRIAKTPRHQVLVFVHGFNTRFGEAVFRLAQITHDSDISAVPLLFTWPSRGELLAYTFDRESANYSRDALEALLQRLQNDPAVGEIDVLAHSMGSWVTVEALRQMGIRNKRLAPKIKYVMLAAPDVDVDVFRRQISEMGVDRPPFTIFVSQSDDALRASRKIWGDRPRLGGVDPNKEPYRTLFKEAKINVVDLSGIATDDRLGHSTFAESPDIVRSIGARIARGQDFNDKGGIADKITQATTTVASTVGSTAGLVISAPLAIVDGRTRDSLGDQLNSVGSGAVHSFGDITTVGGVTLY